MISTGTFLGASGQKRVPFNSSPNDFSVICSFCMVIQRANQQIKCRNCGKSCQLRPQLVQGRSTLPDLPCVYGRNQPIVTCPSHQNSLMGCSPHTGRRQGQLSNTETITSHLSTAI